MAKVSLLTLSASLLLLFGGCFAQFGSQQQFIWQDVQQNQKHRLRAKTDCRIDRLTAQGPSRKFASEAGLTEFWDPNNKQFECAGVEAVRNTIQQKGLLLPHYNNAPQLIYIVRGMGLLGVVIPGCAETFESEVEQQQGSESQRRFLDRHQKIRQFKTGDVLAVPAGVTLWIYNHGAEPLVTVALLDTANEQNQLDLNFRNFFLAGNPYSYSGQQGQGQQGERGPGETQRGKNNIFAGFEEDILVEVFGIAKEIISRLKGQNDRRGHIVRAERFKVILPQGEQEWQQERGQGGPNGLEETLCTARLRENLAHPARADIYNPRAGRIATLNSQTLPILGILKLSAVRGFLYGNAIMAPHWNVNAHSVIYATRGSARFQVVDHTGKLVFDDWVQEGQLIIVPQNYVVVKKAGEQGFEWIAFKTNDNAMVSPLAGRLSSMRSMPVEVLMNSYQISREQAEELKYSRKEAQLFSPRSQSSRSPKSKAMKYALDVIESVI